MPDGSLGSGAWLAQPSGARRHDAVEGHIAQHIGRDDLGSGRGVQAGGIGGHQHQRVPVAFKGPKDSVAAPTVSAGTGTSEYPPPSLTSVVLEAGDPGVGDERLSRGQAMNRVGRGVSLLGWLGRLAVALVLAAAAACGSQDGSPLAADPATSVSAPESESAAEVQSESAPSESVPSESVPSESVPSAQVPSVSVPSVSAPSASVPSESVPSESVPSAQVPSVSVPSAQVPSVSVPSAPSVSVPSVSVPSAQPVGVGADRAGA